MSNEPEGEAPVLDSGQALREWLDGQEFYEMMQAYRHMSFGQQHLVAKIYDQVKDSIRRKVREIYENLREDYITVYESVGGWKAVQLTWSQYPDIPGPGFWEPEQTGVGVYVTEDEAVVEAKSWAESEGLEFKEREVKRN